MKTTRPSWAIWRKGHGYYFWTLGIIWTLLVAASLFWNSENATEQLVELVRVQARTAYDKDVLYRFWNSSHGLVYVPVSPETPPNPYLHVPERDITTPSGTPLTMMNPAYMTRQANELGIKRIGIYGHLTSLNPLRPENAPDYWEAAALQQFEEGQLEVSAISQLQDKQVMRLMKPLFVEKECIECHAEQGYQLGEVRGGISVSIDMAPSLALLQHTKLRLAVGHLLLWLTGVAGLAVRSRMLVKRDRERQLAADALQRLNDELEQRVVERTAELAETNLLLEEDIRQRIASEEEREKLSEQLRVAQKTEIIGTLAGGIAHDFNNLLTPILGYSELAMKRPGVTPPLEKDLRQIFGAADRAKGLVRQILAFSRRSADARHTVSMQQIVREVLELIRPTFPKTIQVTEVLPKEDLLVEADPSQLHQVVMNLATNAMQAMQGKDGALRLQLESRQLQAAEAEALGVPWGDYLCLQVSDTGCGIPSESLDKIFDPFFTTKRKGEGTGLGLSVVQGIIQSHGGVIRVESQFAAGSCFSVFLPQVKEKVKGQLSLTAVPGHGERILLVDDEEEIVEMLTGGLAGYGYRVSGFSSSKAALAAFRKQPRSYDLLLSDRVMPGMGGQQLADAVRALRPGLPVVFMSGYDADCDLASGTTTAGEPCLAKPLTAGEVAARIGQRLAAGQ